jgi:hypothetical protein
MAMKSQLDPLAKTIANDGYLRIPAGSDVKRPFKIGRRTSLSSALQCHATTSSPPFGGIPPQAPIARS